MLCLMMSPLLGGCYSFGVAVEYTKAYMSRRPVEEVQQDPKVSPAIKEKLETVDKIIAYAKKQGLHTQGAYRYFIADSKEVVSYLLEVAYPDRLESVTWWFPIIGSVPYKGFFSKVDRDEAAKPYYEEGYDVFLTGASAFSSLGWLEDPIYEPMLRDSFGSLCELFFHELTHRTLWVKNQVPFNEALATYMGYVLTLQYLDELKDTREKGAYLDEQTDRKLFLTWLTGLTNELKALYKNPPNSRDTLLAEKKKRLERFVHEEKPKFKLVDFVGKKEWNHARILANQLYAPDLERFSRAHHCLPQTDVNFFLTTLAERVKGASDPFKVLDDLCVAKI